VIFHEFCDDCILALQLGFQGIDASLFGILGLLVASAILPEGQVGILEKLALPQIKRGDTDLEFVTNL
jgi:uncharacterized membrane protein